MNEKKYCIWCGSEITSDSKFCPKCGKEQTEEENQLIDWLVSKTKDKLKGDAESTLIEAIKNYIMSHLYGTFMTISIVAASAITIYASEPYINKVNADEISYLPAVENNVENEVKEDVTDTPSVNPPYDMEANSNIHSKTSRYLTDINNVGQTYYNTGRIITVEDLKVPESSGLRGVYEVVKDDRFRLTSASYKGTEFDPALHTTEISKRLTSQGYNVGESIVEEWGNEQNGLQGYRKMMFVYVQLDGQWLMVENRILELTIDRAVVPGSFDQDFAPEFTLDGTGDAYRIMTYLEDLYLSNDTSTRILTYSGYTAEHDMPGILENGVKERSVSITSEKLDDVENKYIDIQNTLAGQNITLYQTKIVLDIEGTLSTKMKQTYTVLFVETGAEIRILDTILTEDTIIF